MLIGISGKKRAGKDTFFRMMASRIKAKHPEIEVVHLAFADKVKEFAATYFQQPTNGGDKEASRFILQGIGEMIREEVDREFWINKVAALYRQHLLENGKHPWVAAITDMRYGNEKEWVIRNGGILVRISKDSDVADAHHSETALSDEDFDTVIENNGTLEEFQRKVIEWTDKNL